MPRSLLASGVTSAVLLMGCATNQVAGWRVEPSMQVAHAPDARVAAGYVAMARQYEGERRMRQALDAWRKAAAAAPYDPDILDALGMAEAVQGELARAIEVFKVAVVLAPQRAWLHNNLGHALRLAGRTDESRAAFKQALAIDPAYRVALNNLGRLDAEAALVASVPAAPAAPVVPVVPAAAQVPAATQMAAVPPPAPAPVAPFTTSSAPTVPALLPATAALQPPVATAAPEAPRETAARTVALLQPEPALGVAALPTAPRLQAQVWEQLVAIATTPPATVLVKPAALATAEPVAAAAPPAAPKGLAPLTARVEFSNGNGVEGMAAWMRGYVRARGLVYNARLTNTDFTTQTTVVQYRDGFVDEARRIAAALPRPAVVADGPATLARGDVRVVIGHDIRSATACAAVCPTYADAPAAIIVAEATAPR